MTSTDPPAHTCDSPGDHPAPDDDRPALDDNRSALDDREDHLLRALADLDNMRKRYAGELRRERAAERSTATAAWLPVLDNLERALAHADADPSVIVAGVRAVRDQAVEVLDRLGYPRRDEVGVPFDPARHEVVAVVENTGAPPGTVLDVVRPGYGDAERQLRPEAVAVSGRQDGVAVSGRQQD